MFARNIALRLKPNPLAEFTQNLDNEVIPMLRKQKGFQDEITFCTLGGMMSSPSVFGTHRSTRKHTTQRNTPICSRA